MRFKRLASSYERQRLRAGYVFTLPFIVGLCLFFFWPVVQSVIFSFHKLVMDPSSAVGYTLNPVGWDNYKQALFVDAQFRKQVLNSLGEMAINVPVVVIFSFFIASLLNQKFIGRTVARAVFFLPLIIASSVVVKMDMADYFGSSLASGMQFGSAMPGAGESLSSALIRYLTEINIDQRVIDFLVGTVARVYDIAVMSAIPIIIFLAGLQSIPPSVFEAAYIEGATKWEVFWKVSFPMVSPLILVTVVFSVVDSFTKVTNVVIERIHSTAFDLFDFGFSSAMAWIYTLIVVIVIAVVFKLIAKRVFYNN